MNKREAVTIARLRQEFKDHAKYTSQILDEIKTDVKANTEFRLKSKGIIGAVGFISAAFGGFFLWVLGKAWPKIRGLGGV